MTKRIRIKDIAEKAGVSAGTVDRVLHNRGSVSALVKQRVLEVMASLGYEPNIIASTLAYNRTRRIATLMPEFHSDPYWAQPDLGIERAFQAVRHYGVVRQACFFGLFDPDQFMEQAHKILDDSPDGILFAPVFHRESKMLLQECRERHIPNVMINTHIENADSLCYIGQDSYQSGVLAARLLHFGLNRGDTVLLVNLEVGSYNAMHLIDKEKGFRDYFARFPAEQIHIVKKDMEEFDDTGKMSAFLQDLFCEHPALKGIFFTNSRAYKAVRCMEPERRKQVKLVGFDLIPDNLAFLRDQDIDFLINQNPVQQGFLGVTSLFNHLVKKEEVERKQYLPLDIVVTENVDYYLRRQEEMQLFV